MKIEHRTEANTGRTLEELAAALDALNRAGAPMDAKIATTGAGATMRTVTATWTAEDPRP